jgi:hypothetical protein
MPSLVRRLSPALAAVLAVAGVATLRPGIESGACAQDAVVPRNDCDDRQTYADQTCAAVRTSFRSVRVRPAGRGLRFAFTRRVARPVRIDVFQASVGRRVIGESRVFRAVATSSPARWSGRGARDGILYARLQIRDERGRTDTRRIALARRNGRFALRPAFYRSTSCATLTAFKLERPVFGGRGARTLGIAFRLARAGRVSIEVRRGGRVVRRFPAAARTANVTHRLRLGARGLRRGRYEVRLRFRGTGGSVRASLYAERL